MLPSEPNGEIQSLYKWFPDEKQWWITGFDYSRQSPDPARLVTVGYIDLSGYVDVYEQVKLSENLKKNIDLEEMQKLYHNLIFDNKNNYIWFVWSD